jgi:LysR family tcuABC transcriptional regulator
MVSLADDELSPAALATRIVLQEVARALVEQGRWPGARLL